jgi:Plasmid pRiA4b ORF-3-like protein
MPTAKAPPSIYELKITLADIAPPIWRRFRLPSDMRMCCIHSALQVVMGWTDSHLHLFEKDGINWGVVEWDEFGDLELRDEDRVPIGDVLKAAGESLRYTYDFGDDWVHEVVLEKILPADTDAKRPVCVAGERRCPPEDVGGPHGYQEFLEVIFTPGHEEFEHYRQWAGNAVHAEEFDVAAVNKTLSRMRWPVRHRR